MNKNSHYLWSFIVFVVSVLTNISLVNGDVVSSTTKTITSKTLPSFTIKNYTAVPFITYPTTKTPPTTTKSLYNFSVENPPIVKSVKTVPFVKTTKTVPCLFSKGNTYHIDDLRTTPATYNCKGFHKRAVSTGKALSTKISKTLPSNALTPSVTTPTTIETCHEIFGKNMNDILRNDPQIFTLKTISSTLSTLDIPNTTTETKTTEVTEPVETTESLETTITTSTKTLPNIITVTITNDVTITNEVTVTNEVTITNEITVTVNQCSCSTPTPTPSDTQCSKRFEQCGGLYYKGPTCCQTGKCQKVNEFYYQCI